LANRGEVWLADFEPVRGHEQGRQRPAVILSTDQFNNGPAALVVVVPLTTTERARMPLRVRVNPPDGGLRETSWALREAFRSICDAAWGALSARTLATIEHRVRTPLDL
jgi:mRNA interferase MazF